MPKLPRSSYIAAIVQGELGVAVRPQPPALKRMFRLRPNCVLFQRMTRSASNAAADAQPLSGDRPIETATQDRLGYAPFARAIATSIVKRAPLDGIVYAIHGPWGSGKTSAVNMLVEAVEGLEADKAADTRIIVVRFNPWWFSEQSGLTRMFFSELASTLEKKASKKVAEGLRKVGRQVTGAKDALLAGLSLIPGGALASPLLSGAIDALKPHFDECDSLDGARNELIAALKEQNRRILVIIDDVDRLPADEVKQIFRLVKSVADLPNIIYLLVFDRNVARKALGGPTSMDGPEWLEKIVQASFDLPPVHPIDLRRMFIGPINDMVGDRQTGSDSRAANIMFQCVFPWLQTPRDVGRLLNAVNVSLPVVIDEVNITDFIAIETLRMFEPDLYEFIRTHQDELTGINNSSRGVDKTIGEKILGNVSNGKHARVKVALQRLFPKLDSVWSNLHYGSDSSIGWDKERRICVSRYFPTYFSFTHGDDVLTASETARIIESLNDIATFSVEIGLLSKQPRRNGTTKAALVFDVISLNISSILSKNLRSVVKTLLNSAHLLRPYHGREDGGDNYPFTWGYWFPLSPLLKQLSRTDRLELILDAIRNSPDVASLIFVVTAIEGEFGLHEGGEKLSEEERSVDDSGLKQLQDCLRNRIEILADSGDLASQDDLSQILYRWSELSGSKTVLCWSSAAMKRDEDALALVDAALHRGTSWGDGDVTTKTFYQINRESASRYVDVDALAMRLEEIASVNVETQELAMRFRKALESKNRWDI
ncbi:MAG: P-loop NTPase fold protein [Methylobacterium sp.]|uniref:KAP family P-loop NTPase fold protein n=1 Tax=Methylobacterium sp. TaxID=409 RepID=UPI0027189A28|nr:P-loop NTPase fold protein [Methylobacterium sp.]MDO9425304.1 P-loop NTPase fold protein [Methylobacterium sp.]